MSRVLAPVLLAAWRYEEQTPFADWDFSHLAARMVTDAPPLSVSFCAASYQRLFDHTGP